MVQLKDIINYFRAEGNEVIPPVNDFEREITACRNIFEAGTNEISFISNKYSERYKELLSNSKSALIIADNSINLDLIKSNVNFYIVLSNNPKKAMLDCLNKFFVKEVPMGIHESAIIHESVIIGQKNYIGQYCIIDNDVQIGNNCILESGVTIREKCILGNNVIVKSGSVIGGRGFGYIKGQNGNWTSFPHFGRVIIEDNVEIGSNSCIDRGSLGDTILRKGVKVDNLVHIAHNVIVGENSLLIADAMIGGSVTIGNDTWVAPSAVIRNGLNIGSNVVIGMGAIVTKNVEDKTTVMGNPAFPFIGKKK